MTAVAAAETPADPDRRVETVTFAKGEVSRTINGTIRGREYVDFQVAAGAGQSLGVTLKRGNAMNYFNIIAPGANEALFIGSTSGRQVKRMLVTDGVYTIRLYLMRAAARRNERSDYALNIAVDHAGPTIMLHGTPEQKAAHLPRILRGEVLWCQGFSEPGAGSDLAGLRLKGVVEGDEIIVTGQKAWSSHAHLADWQELLIRTGPTTPRHGGITWAICDMRAPGITVRPVPTMANNHHFCDVFYDNVRIPLSNVVGGVGQGWRMAMSTLSLERGSLAVGRSADLARFIDEILQAFL
jgi:alkylation response protein AidB-like acyl-CoA dehydrogenase